MKLKKKSGLISAVIALSCASIVSVGFASWVISQGDEETVQGTILVDEVSDQSHVLTVSSTGVNPIAFKANATTAGKGWLTADAAGENLVASYGITVTNLTDASKISATVKAGKVVDGAFVEDASSAGYLKANSEGLVGALPTPAITGSSTDGTFSGSVALTFTWGSHFGGDNPMDFYNGFEADDEITTGVTYAADASAKLNLLKTDLTDVVYQLKIVVAA